MSDRRQPITDEDTYADYGVDQCRSRYGGSQCTRRQGHATEWHTNYGAVEWDDDNED